MRQHAVGWPWEQKHFDKGLGKDSEQDSKTDAGGGHVLTGGQERRTGLTVAEAADVLGISKDAVRKRIARGTLQAAKQDGEWMVFLDDGDQYKTSSQDAEDTSHFWELINDQKQEIERLRQELEKKDAWITELIQRIPPQLPAPEQQAAATREGWWQRLWRRK